MTIFHGQTSSCRCNFNGKVVKGEEGREGKKKAIFTTFALLPTKRIFLFAF